jgi:hypothetical protein
MARKPSAGVYLVRCGKSVYVGSTQNLYRRKLDHAWRLFKEIHPNKALQKGWNDSNSFEFIPLEFLAIQGGESVNQFRDRLRAAEQSKIDCYAALGSLVNVSTNSRGPCSSVPKFYSKESRARMAESNRGRKPSADSRAKMALAKTGEKNHKSKRVEIRDPQGVVAIYGSCSLAAKFFGVTQQLFQLWVSGQVNWPSERSKKENRWIAGYSARLL